MSRIVLLVSLTSLLSAVALSLYTTHDYRTKLRDQEEMIERLSSENQYLRTQQMILTSQIKQIEHDLGRGYIDSVFGTNAHLEHPLFADQSNCRRSINGSLLCIVTQ